MVDEWLCFYAAFVTVCCVHCRPASTLPGHDTARRGADATETGCIPGRAAIVAPRPSEALRKFNPPSSLYPIGFELRKGL